MDASRSTWCFLPATDWKNNTDPDGAKAVLAEMGHLVDLIQTDKRSNGNQHWQAGLFLADDPENQERLGIEPVVSDDAWRLKLALADLDTALARHGEMIGALLIVGGPEVVAFPPPAQSGGGYRL